MGSTSCPGCGAPVGTTGGRCPFCGAEIPSLSAPGAPSPPSTAAPVGYSQGAAAYGGASVRPPRPRPKTGASSGAIAGIAVGVIAIGGAGAYVFWRISSASPPATAISTKPPPPPSATVAPEVVVIADPKQVDPSDLYPRARARATKWSPDARLVSIVARPAADKKIDLTAADARIAYTFFSKGHDPRGKDPTGRYVVTIVATGASDATAPGNLADDKNAVDEPLCVSWQALKAVRASGVPADQAVDLVYQMDAGLGRAIWTATVPGKKDLERLVDGNNCAIVRRR